jgi:hypothetical protein
VYYALVVKNPSMGTKSESKAIIKRNTRKLEDAIKTEFGKMDMEMFFASSGSAQCPLQRFCEHCDVQ